MTATMTEAPPELSRDLSHGPVPAPGQPDPEAPYGRFANGKPRKSPRGAAEAKRPKPSSRPSSSSTRRSAPKGPDYRPGILGIFQTVSIPLAFAAPADAIAIQEYAPGVAEALNDLAKERPEVAAALERVMQVGPYGALIGAVVPLAVQLLHNHDVIPERMAVQIGATPKRHILAGLRQQAEDAEQHQAAEQHPADPPRAAASPADMPFGARSHAVSL